MSESKDGAKKSQKITADSEVAADTVAADQPAAGQVAGEASGDGAATADGPLDPRERFRQALERKNATPGTHPGSQSTPGSRMPGSNGKTKRQFRRKSG